MSNSQHRRRSPAYVPDPTLGNLRGRIRAKEPEIDFTNALVLPHERLAFVYQRLSTTEQIKNSLYSLQMQDSLEDLAVEDGYTADFGLDERQRVREDSGYVGWYRNGQIIVEQRDLGISGTKGTEHRPGLQHLIALIEANRVESIYVVHVSRLFRDQTLINAFSFGELCKKHDVKLITPYIRLNLRIQMHMEWYRREADWAAKELETIKTRLHSAKDMKARQGRYAGAPIPPGYVVDTRRKIVVDGREVDNPNYERYMVFEPHAHVVRTIMRRLSIPNTTPVQVVRYCHSQGIRFEPFPPELAQVKANLKSFNRRRMDPDGSWPVSPGTVVSVATNPVYLGWWIWDGEVVRIDNHPAIIDEATFRTVQANMSSRTCRPKKHHPPLLLGGLLRCGRHDPPRRMSYSNRERPRSSEYFCVDPVTRVECCSLSARILDEPISDFVLSQFTRPELAEAVLERLEGDYDEAREQAEAVRRDLLRLDEEIANLEHNYRVLKLTPERAAKFEADITTLMAQKRQLADVDAYPIGKVTQALSSEELGFVRSILTDMRQIWADQSGEVRNAFLHLILDEVLVYPQASVIRVVIRWRPAAEHVIEITRPLTSHRKPWTAEEDDLLRTYYPQGLQILMEKLPHRGWLGIKRRAKRLGVYRVMSGSSVEPRTEVFHKWTPEEDEIIRQLARHEITMPQAMLALGVSDDIIRYRANEGLGLSLEKPLTWRLLESRTTPTSDDPSW